MGLHIGRKSVSTTKAVFVLVAFFALVTVPTFLGTRGHVVHAETPSPQFIGSPRYVHANTESNLHDIAAEIEFFPGTTQLQLKIDNAPITEGNVTNPMRSSAASGSNKIELRMKFAPGMHKITGTAIVEDRQVDIRGSNGEQPGVATVYAIDAPTVDYIVPGPNKRSFNSYVTPVRVKIDNEFDQFKNLEFSLFKGVPGDTGIVKFGDFALTADQCDLKQAIGFAVCDITAASNWKQLDEGVYFVKLQSSTKAESSQRMDGINDTDDKAVSLPFTIDDTAPRATIEGPLSVVGGEKIMIQGTIDSDASETVLYIDDKAIGPVVLGENDRWTYDLTADLALGSYKMKLLVKDEADNTNTATIDAATTNLTVNPFMPSKAEVQQVNDAAVGLTNPFATPQALTHDDILPALAPTDSDMAVLGAKDATSSKMYQKEVIATVAPSSEGWKLFGIAWFWWLLAATFLTGVSLWVFTSRQPVSDGKHLT